MAKPKMVLDTLYMLRLDHQAPSITVTQSVDGLSQQALPPTNRTGIGFCVASSNCGQLHELIDDALRDTSMGTELFVPSLEFKRFDQPAGSGRFPYSCPLWEGRTDPRLQFELDPSLYDYTGGSTKELRMTWFDTRHVNYERYEQTFGDTPFCRCNFPFVGTPPACTWTCGPERYYRTTESGCVDDGCWICWVLSSYSLIRF